VRRILPKCWFNQATIEAGLDALGFYHERRDRNRNVGLGPDHDWSSNCADSFGYMAITWEALRDSRNSSGDQGSNRPGERPPGASHWSV
jgi:phage terminase large subunit